MNRLLKTAGACVLALAVSTSFGQTTSVKASGLIGTLPASAEPAHTGDVTNTAGSLDMHLATVNSSPGNCGDATHVCVVVTDSKGRVLSQSPVVISAAGLGSNSFSGQQNAPSFGGTTGKQTVMYLSQGTAADAAPAGTIRFGAPLVVVAPYDYFFPGSAPTDPGGDVCVLPSGGGTCTWKAYASDGVQLQQQSIVSPVTSITFSVPSGFTKVRVELFGQTSDASASAINMTFNGDGSNLYNFGILYTSSTIGSGTPGSYVITAQPAIQVAGAFSTSASGYQTQTKCEIAGYTSAHNKSVNCQSSGWLSGGVPQASTVGGSWARTDSITSITLLSDFAAGTVATLYGVQ